jgi:hypothetical protein
MDFTPPDCHSDLPTSCTQPDWVQCAECARFICMVHEEVASVRHAGKYAADMSTVCIRCTQTLYENSELAMIRSGYQYINGR